MAEQQQTTQQSSASSGQGNRNGSDARKTAIRAAVIAAASGATAIAARKAFSDRRQGSGRAGERGGDSMSGDDSLVGSMLVSGWDAAKDSLLPIAEDAAGKAGEYLARNGPELVRDTLVPRFIEGFERGTKSERD